MFASLVRGITVHKRSVLLFCSGSLFGGISHKIYEDYFNKTEGIRVVLKSNIGETIEQFVTNDEFQGFFEHNIEKCDSVDFFILKKAIEIDHNNLKLLSNDLKTEQLEKIAIDRDISALKYCRKDSKDKLIIYDYAYEKYGQKISEYI